MEIEYKYIYKNIGEDILNENIVYNRIVFQYKELRIPIPQVKNTRFRFVIDQRYQEKTDVLKVKVEQLNK